MDRIYNSKYIATFPDDRYLISYEESSVEPGTVRLITLEFKHFLYSCSSSYLLTRVDRPYNTYGFKGKYRIDWRVVENVILNNEKHSYTLKQPEPKIEKLETELETERAG